MDIYMDKSFCWHILVAYSHDVSIIGCYCNDDMGCQKSGGEIMILDIDKTTEEDIEQLRDWAEANTIISDELWNILIKMVALLEDKKSIVIDDKEKVSNAQRFTGRHT